MFDLYGFFVSWSVLFLTLIIGVLMDGALLRKDKDENGRGGTAPTVAGWAFFGIMFLVINILFGLLSLLFDVLNKKKKLEWKNLLAYKPPHKYVGFWYAVLFLITEIAMTLLLEDKTSPAILSLLALNKSLLLPIYFLTASSFVILFFRMLPYAEKSKNYVRGGWLVIILSLLVIYSILHDQYGSVQGLLNATAYLNATG